MEEKIIHSVAGIFDTPDDIIKAAKAVSSAGYKKFDIHTPYPVHGMDSAMKLPWSPLGYVALVLGLFGAGASMLFMWWTMSQDYPIVYGGKPLFPMPALIPVSFEITVLLASVGTVLAMMIFFFKFPNTSHPLHDTSYIKRVSSDKYGVCIESSDKMFDERKVSEFLKKLGASDVQEIYWDNDELNTVKTILDKKFIGAMIVLALIVGGTTYFAINKLVYMTPFNWMMEQPRLDAQSKPEFFKDGFSMREPVEGTVAKGWMPYLITDADTAKLSDPKYMNPVEPTEYNLNKGERNFNVYCSPCHDYHGTGVSRLTAANPQQFPNPPSLHSLKVRNWSDARMFHVLTVGQNTMPSYARQTTPEERWQIIHYVRVLQRAMNAKEEDVK